jgi:hypothetical protein
MAGGYAVLAGAVVLAHLLFVAFVVSGALLALRWRWMPWIHLPTVAWAAFIEFSGGICPLTPLENELRAAAGLGYYSGDFIAEYLFPLLYPEGLTRTAQAIIGSLVLAINVAAYGWLLRRRAYKKEEARFV